MGPSSTVCVSECRLRSLPEALGGSVDASDDGSTGTSDDGSVDTSDDGSTDAVSSFSPHAVKNDIVSRVSIFHSCKKFENH